MAVDGLIATWVAPGKFARARSGLLSTKLWATAGYLRLSHRVGTP